jgi:poly(3-hydroxybutyrate) depolymerase
MDADYYLETIKVVFQDFCLVNGTWDVRGVDGKLERVRPQDITTTALFTVEGELDDISGSGQTGPCTPCAAVSSAAAEALEVKGAGHYGIFCRPALARDGVPAGQGLHPAASASRPRNRLRHLPPTSVQASRQPRQPQHHAPWQAMSAAPAAARQKAHPCPMARKAACPGRKRVPARLARHDPWRGPHPGRAAANPVHPLRLPGLRGLCAGHCAG